MTRAEARALGLQFYSSDIPCRRGHVSQKHVREGCLECRRVRRYKHRDSHPKESWVEDMVRQAKSRARKANPPIPHTLTAKDIMLIVTDKCPVFDTPFVFKGNKKMLPESPSLDRLNPKLGYVPGNVAVISVKANLIKNAYGSEDILKVGHWLKGRGL